MVAFLALVAGFFGASAAAVSAPSAATFLAALVGFLAFVGLAFLALTGFFASVETLYEPFTLMRVPFLTPVWNAFFNAGALLIAG